MFCNNCGAPIQEGQAFCIRCGTEVPEAPSGGSVSTFGGDSSGQNTVVMPPVLETPITYRPDEEQYQPPVYTPPVIEKPTPSSSGKNRTAIIIAIIVVLLAIAGAVLALVLSGGNSDNDDRSDRPNRREDSGIVDETDGPADTTKAELSSSNVYYEFFVDADSYVLSATNSRYYSRAELSGMTRQQLYLAEREMYARYGCTFNDGDLDAYFGAKNWYSPDSPAGNFNDTRFTPTERVNLLLLRSMIMERDGTASNNEYLKINNDVEGWILNFTDSTRITKEDVQNLSEKALMLASYEIYARRGYIFDDDDLQLYFSGKNWYTPQTPAASFDAETVLSEIEQENYLCLQSCAEKKAGVKFSSGSKFKDYYDSYSEYICPGSDIREIDPRDLQYMNEDELTLARNEIYARYGYSFSGTNLREYFMQCSWYYPTVVPTKLDLIHLSKLELANVKMIQAFELNLKLAKGEGKVNEKMSYYAKHDFMTMYLPAHWQDHCLCVKPDGTAGDLYFYEKHNKEVGYGWLYTVLFVPFSEGLGSYSGSNTEVFGTVTAPDGTQYYMLIQRPASYSSNTMFLENVYELMRNEIDTILDSIEWKSGYTFTPA